MNLFRITSFGANPLWHLEQSSEDHSLCAEEGAATPLTLVHQPIPDASTLPLGAVCLVAVIKDVDICETCLAVAELRDELDFDGVPVDSASHPSRG